MSPFFLLAAGKRHHYFELYLSLFIKWEIEKTAIKVSILIFCVRILCKYVFTVFYYSKLSSAYFPTEESSCAHGFKTPAFKRLVPCSVNGKSLILRVCNFWLSCWRIHLLVYWWNTSVFWIYKYTWEVWNRKELGNFPYIYKRMITDALL